MGEKLAGSSRKKVRKKIMGTVLEKTAWRGMEETVSIGNEKPQQNNSLFFSFDLVVGPGSIIRYCILFPCQGLWVLLISGYPELYLLPYPVSELK